MADVSDDIMIFETEDGGEQRVQYIDSVFYNGDEYAILADLPDGAETIDDIEDDQLEIFFMKIVPHGDDDEEVQAMLDVVEPWCRQRGITIRGDFLLNTAP